MINDKTAGKTSPRCGIVSGNLKAWKSTFVASTSGRVSTFISRVRGAITYLATGPAASEPMKALEAPRRDSTVHELEAFPPLCHRWDKHLQMKFINDQTKFFPPVLPPNRGGRNNLSAVCSHPEDIRWRTVQHSATSGNAHILTITKRGYIYGGKLDSNTTIVTTALFKQ